MGFKNMKKDILINVLIINKIYVRPATKMKTGITIMKYMIRKLDFFGGDIASI